MEYIKIIEGEKGGKSDLKKGKKNFEYERLKKVYRDEGGKDEWMVNNGYDRKMEEEEVEEGSEEIVDLGKKLIENNDMVRRMKEKEKMKEIEKKNMYGGGEKGYKDYKVME